MPCDCRCRDIPYLRASTERERACLTLISLAVIITSFGCLAIASLFGTETRLDQCSWLSHEASFGDWGVPEWIHNTSAWQTAEVVGSASLYGIQTVFDPVLYSPPGYKYAGATDIKLEMPLGNTTAASAAEDHSYFACVALSARILLICGMWGVRDLIGIVLFLVALVHTVMCLRYAARQEQGEARRAAALSGSPGESTTEVGLRYHVDEGSEETEFVPDINDSTVHRPPFVDLALYAAQRFTPAVSAIVPSVTFVASELLWPSLIWTLFQHVFVHSSVFGSLLALLATVPIVFGAFAWKDQSVGVCTAVFICVIVIPVSSFLSVPHAHSQLAMYVFVDLMSIASPFMSFASLKTRPEFDWLVFHVVLHIGVYGIRYVMGLPGVGVALMYQYGVFPMIGVLVITAVLLVPYAAVLVLICTLLAAVCDAFPDSTDAAALSSIATKMSLKREPTIWATLSSLYFMRLTEMFAAIIVTLHIVSVLMMPLAIGASDLESFQVFQFLHPTAEY